MKPQFWKIYINIEHCKERAKTGSDTAINLEAVIVLFILQIEKQQQKWSVVLSICFKALGENADSEPLNIKYVAQNFTLFCAGFIPLD